MKFSLVADHFEKLSKTSSRLEIAQILKELFSKCSKEDISNLIYFCKGNLGPKYKNKEINIGQSILISLISQYLGVPEEVIKKEYSKLGDLGLVIEKTKTAKKQKVLFSKELDFSEVFSIFLKIAETKGKGSTKDKQKLFKYILFNSDKISAKYLVRFPISFRLGFGDSTIIDALAMIDSSIEPKKAKKIITEKYDLISDLGLIANIIKEKGILGIEYLSLNLFVPIKSALCERAKNLEEIQERIKECAIDSKIDGFRQQVHKKGDLVKIFSRREEDITNMFPDVVKEVKKIPHDFIIDCEAVGFDPVNKKYYSFQITMQRKRKYDIKQKSKELPLHLKVFDVLYLDGKELISKPFKERRKILEENFNYPPVILPTELIITDKLEEINKFFKQRLSLGLEGIIAKDLLSTYKAGSRGFSWIKFKKSYSNVHDTIDACIAGGFYGQGKWSKFGIGALLMVIYDKDTDKYYTIAKLGSGLTEDILKQLSSEISNLKIPKPNNLETNIEADFYVIPKVIIEINYDGITNSLVHTACFNKITKQGLALRFPRIVKIRNDKSEKQTTTQEELKRLYSIQ